VNVRIDTISTLAVVEWEGRIASREDALRLRYAVMSQQEAPIIVLDLTEVIAIEGVGLEMLLFLQRWTSAHDIQFRLFNPSNYVRLRLLQADRELKLVTLDDLIALSADFDSTLAMAA
jgi:anti-anti-sigma regulatory factor